MKCNKCDFQVFDHENQIILLQFHQVITGHEDEDND